MNMFIRSHPRFEIEAEKAKAIVRAAQVVASDETGVRIEGTNSYHWVFHCKDAVVHKPDYSRAARVVDEMMAGHKPTVWISDRYSAQQKHGERHQTCLAHLARDTAFALEHGSDDLPFRFKLWLGKAFGLAKAIADFAASTLARKKRDLERQLEVLLAASTGCDLARELQAKIGRARNQLLTFCDYPGEVDVTNNTSERKLRPCVIQRKITNGYRAMWAAQAEADVNNHRYRKAQGREPLRRDRPRPGLITDRTANARLKNRGWVIARAVLVQATRVEVDIFQQISNIRFWALIRVLEAKHNPFQKSSAAPSSVSEAPVSGLTSANVIGRPRSAPPSSALPKAVFAQGINAIPSLPACRALAKIPCPISCEPCGRRERHDGESLKRRYSWDVKGPDLLLALVADCPSVYDRCKAVYERR